MAYFEKTYGPPWEGVDASQGAANISEHALSAFNVSSQGGKSSGYCFKAGQLWNPFTLTNTTGPYVNEPTKPNAVGLYTFYQTIPVAPNTTGYAYGLLGYYGDTRLYRLANGTPPAWSVFGVGTFPANTALFQNPNYYLPLQGFLYLPVDGGSILKVDAAAGAITSLTNFTSCRYIGELGGHLLGAFTIEGVIPSTNFPYRIRWSGNYNFSQWNSAVDATAGFQDLSDVEDAISGLFTFGSVGYILRGNGITQINVTSNGTAPFQFDHLWKSNQGLGCLFPFSAAQYGPLGVFVGRDDIYMLSSSGYEGIGGKAKNAIFESIFPTTSRIVSAPIIGAIIPHLGTPVIPGPALGYILSIPVGFAGNTDIWFYNFADKMWSRNITNPQISTFPAQFLDSHSDSALSDPDTGTAFYGDIQNIGVRGQGLIAIGGVGGAQQSISQEGGANTLTAYFFKLECPRLGRKFTLHKIYVELFSPATPATNIQFTILGSTLGTAFTTTKAVTWQSAMQFGEAILDKVLSGERLQIGIGISTPVTQAISIQRVVIIGNDGDGDQL